MTVVFDEAWDKLRSLAASYDGQCSEIFQQANSMPPTHGAVEARKQREQRAALTSQAAMFNAIALGILLAMEVIDDIDEWDRPGENRATESPAEAGGNGSEAQS